MGKKKEHQWFFMGNDTKGRGDLQHCDLCNRWAWSSDYKKMFKLSPEQFQKMLDTKEITGF